MRGFVDFIRERGVMGLAIGFILGGAISKTVASLVEDIINPLIGLALGRINLVDKAFNLGNAAIKYGSFISAIINFIIIAAVVYFGFKILKLEKLDKKKEPKL